MKKKYDQEKLLADWKTGGYSQRKLAKKHGISAGMVARLTKGIPKDSKHLVDALVQAQKALEGKTAKEVSAVNDEVARLLEADTMIKQLTTSNLEGLAFKLEHPENLSMADHKAAQDMIDKASITLGVNQRFAGAAVINNTQEMPSTIVLVEEELTVEALEREIIRRDLPLPYIN